MSQSHWKIIACLFPVLATITVYGEVRNHQFVNFDDDLYITDNAPVQGGLSLEGLIWAFTTTHAGFWHPLTWLSLMLVCQLFGLHPAGFHLTNLLFHVVNALLLFLWLNRTTRAQGASFLVAALFALHPLQVESVAWVTERKDVLSTFFWLLTMWAYVCYVEGPGFGRYLLTLVCFVLGLMAKPMLVTLPFVLLLVDFWPFGRWTPAIVGAGKGQPPGQRVTLIRLVWEKAPLFALTALFCILAFHAEKEYGALTPLKGVPWTGRLSNALVAYVTYLGKMVCPILPCFSKATPRPVYASA